MIQMNRFRICVCYVITTLLLGIFVYTLISNNIQNARELKRLREEMDEIAHLVLHNSVSGHRDTSNHLSELVDTMIKKRLSGIWEDLFNLKKSLKINQDAKGMESPEDAENSAMTAIVERVNFASDELGAKILSISAEPICPTSFLKSCLGMEFSCNPPINMLRSTMKPGNCFGFRNTGSAEVTVQLSHEILLDQILLEHIPRHQSPTGDTTSAPKDFEIIAIFGDLHEFSLGKYRFHNDPKRTSQYFTVLTSDRVGILKFRFQTNHGHPSYTCVYRIAVYGRL